MCDQYARSTGTPWWCWRSLSFVPTSLYAWESPRDSTALRKSVTCWYASSRTGRRTKGQRYHADSRSRFADVSDARRTSCADGALLRPTAVFQNTSARPTAWSTPAQRSRELLRAMSSCRGLRSSSARRTSLSTLCVVRSGTCARSADPRLRRSLAFETPRDRRFSRPVLRMCCPLASWSRVTPCIRSRIAESRLPFASVRSAVFASPTARQSAALSGDASRWTS